MTINLSAWLSDAGDLAATPTATEEQRAALAHRRILDKKTDVEFRKPNGSTLSAQSVRVEWDSGSGVATSEAGQTPVRRLVIFGIKGHASLDDTDIKPGYRFVLNSEELRCVDVIVTLGEIQGLFEAV